MAQTSQATFDTVENFQSRIAGSAQNRAQYEQAIFNALLQQEVHLSDLRDAIAALEKLKSDNIHTSDQLRKVTSSQLDSQEIDRLAKLVNKLLSK